MKPSMNRFECRAGCGACCIAPSISSAIPGMPDGKPAGVRCIQLDEQLGCKLFGQDSRPAVCSSLQPSREMCGESREQAMIFLQRLEVSTSA
jgi:Fe-S-cluster containining protein